MSRERNPRQVRFDTREKNAAPREDFKVCLTSYLHPNKEYHYFPPGCFIVATIKTCLGWLGRKFLLCYFPLAATQELEEAWTFLAGIMGSVRVSALRAHVKRLDRCRAKSPEVVAGAMATRERRPPVGMSRVVPWGTTHL